MLKSIIKYDENSNITKNQEEILKKISTYGNNLKDIASKIYSEMKSNLNKEQKINKEKIKYENNLVQAFESIKKIASLIEKFKKINKPSKLQELRLKNLNQQVNILIYTYNLEFAKSFQRNTYNFKEEVKSFWNNYVLNSEFFKSEISENVRVETKFNYIQKAILPLFKNAQDHAFNPDNDFYNRLKNIDLKKEIYIRSYENEKNNSIIVKVKDNGFGIHKDITNKLFQRGASLKKDNITEHGVGLWAVKEFIDNVNKLTNTNLSKIWVESKPGLKTIFKFTIPYSKKEIFFKRKGIPEATEYRYIQ